MSIIHGILEILGIAAIFVFIYDCLTDNYFDDEDFNDHE